MNQTCSCPLFFGKTNEKDACFRVPQNSSLPQSCAKQKSSGVEIGLTFHRRVKCFSRAKLTNENAKVASAIKVLWSCSKFSAAAVCKKSLPFCPLCFHIWKFAKDFPSTQDISQTKKHSKIAVIRADNCNNCSENCELTNCGTPALDYRTFIIAHYCHFKIIKQTPLFVFFFQVSFPWTSFQPQKICSLVSVVAENF